MDNFRNIHPSLRTIFQLSRQEFVVTLRTSWGIPRDQSVLYIVGESLLGPGAWSRRIDKPRRNYRGLFLWVSPYHSPKNSDD